MFGPATRGEFYHGVALVRASSESQPPSRVDERFLGASTQASRLVPPVPSNRRLWVYSEGLVVAIQTPGSPPAASLIQPMARAHAPGLGGFSVLKQDHQYKQSDKRG